MRNFDIAEKVASVTCAGSFNQFGEENVKTSNAAGKHRVTRLLKNQVAKVSVLRIGNAVFAA